jgi:hypothetical protein
MNNKHKKGMFSEKFYSLMKWYNTQVVKYKEKTEHKTDGSQCWCNPKTIKVKSTR